MRWSSAGVEGSGGGGVDEAPPLAAGASRLGLFVLLGAALLVVVAVGWVPVNEHAGFLLLLRGCWLLLL